MENKQMPFTSTLPVSLEGNSGSRTLWKYPCPSHVPSHRIWTLHCLGNWCNLLHLRLSATFGMECLGRLHAVEQGVPMDTRTENEEPHQMLHLEKEEVDLDLMVMKMWKEKRLILKTSCELATAVRRILGNRKGTLHYCTRKMFKSACKTMHA